MRTFLRSKVTLLFLTLGMLIAVPAVAWAAGDQFQDTLVGAASTQTINAGGSFTNTYYVDAGGPDGCDVSSTNPGVFSINVPSGVTKNPTANLSFTACGVGNAQTVDFSSNTPSGASGYSITASKVSGPVNSAGQAGFTLIVNGSTTPSDTTPPVLNLPDDITAEATGSDGATVTYSADATDDTDGTIAANCLPVSGNTFPLGTTTVECSAADAAGNESTGSFTVTVQDTTAPSLNLPANITEEATGPGGAVVTFNATATDLVDSNVDVTCAPASGSTFELGPTTVTCTATDDYNNSTTRSFDVTVRDTTPPALTLPANITKQATSNSQATVTYSASASDLVDGSVPVSCTPASGTSFSAGTTTANSSATDSHNNTANGSFKVTVNFGWTGFFQPVDNPDTLNSVKAGSAVPVKFSLSGNQGLSIFASEIVGTNTTPTPYPRSVTIPCDQTDPVDAIEATVTAGQSSLSYDSSLDQYNYVWKTDKSWAGTCRQLVVKLKDGTTIKQANFKLLK
jgi:hypothetical protein